jgi:hypothetical protein
MATIFVNPGWNDGDNPITVYVLNGYVYKTDPGEGSSTALCYNKLGAENNNDMNGAVSAASDGDTIYVYNVSSEDPLSLSTPSGTYCPPGVFELYLNWSTTSQKNLAVWANKLYLGENKYYIKLGDNGNSISMDFHVSDSFVVDSGKTFSVLNGSSFSISKIEQGGTNSVSFTNNGSIDVSGSTFAADTVETSANTASFLVSGKSKLNIGTLNGTITTSLALATTLNASSITGGSISAQNDLTFTGANTLNGITLDATDRTVTVGTGNSDSLTVGDTSTLNIGTLDGTIKTGSAGTTLNASSITGGGTNGGTITAQGTLTFANNTHLRNITLDATDKTVNVGSYNLRVGGMSTLKIGTLSGAIWLQNGATVSKSTISGGSNGGLFIYDNTPVIFAGENQVNAGWTYEGHYTSIANCGLITVKSIPASGDNPNALDYVPAQRGVLKAIDIWNKGSITAGSAEAENADACSIEVTNLTNTNNNSSLTITCNAESANPSRLKATQGIVNNGMMTLTNSELTANTLTNNGSGISQSTAGMTISNSTVSASGENPLVITNGNSNTSATIEFNKSTVTAGQVTNFSFHNGQGPTWGTWGLVVTNQSFFSVNDLSNTGWIQVTDSTLSATSVYIGKIDNERNYSGKLQVNGTSTLDIASLDGTITIGSGYFPDPITLKDSHITGKVDNGNRLGNISVTNPLTFTGANTLTNISVDATANCGAVTVGTNEGDSLTMKGTSSLRTASLNGTILTDADDLTTLKDSSITGGTITAQNDLTFTGANTLNSVTLNAANKTVTNTGTLTVGGALSFDGDLNVAGNASLAVGNGAGMTVTGNISNSGSITVTGTGSLSVANIINSYDNSNENNNGTITVDALSTLKADTVSGGRVTVKRDSSQVLTEDVYHMVDANLQNVTVGFIGDLGDYTFCPSFVDSGLYLFKLNPSTVYVNGNYPAQPNTLTPDGHLVGVNAFTNNPDGTETSLYFSNNTEKIVYYANAYAYAALNLAVDNAPASLTITTEAVGNNEVVTMGPLTVGAGQTVTLSGAKMTLQDATEPATDSLTVSSGSTLNVGGESTSGLTAQTVNNAGTINVTNSTFAASTLTTSAVDDRFFVAGESTLNIESLNGKITLNDGATVSNSTVYANVNVGETTTSYSGLLSIATGSSVTFAGANTFRDSNNEKGVAIDNLGTVTVKSIAASGDNSAVAGALKVFGFDNKDTLRVGSDTDACTFDVMNLRNYSTLTVNGKTDDLSRLKASSVENYGTIELTKAIAEAGSLQNGNADNTTVTIGITNSEFTADSVTNYSSGANAREGMTVINSTLFKANSLVNSGTIKFRGKNKLDIGPLSGTLYFDDAEGTQATLNDSSVTGANSIVGTLLAVSNLTFTGENTLANITISAVSRDVTVGDSDPETVDSLTLTNSTLTASEVTTSNGGTLTVSGTNNTLNIGTLNGEIKTAGGVTLTGSNITGGSITALGSVTVNNSTISSNTFTATEYGADFYSACILNGVTLYAGSQSVKIGEGNTDSLTVSGTSTLIIGELHGSRTIKLDGAMIKDSSIVGGQSGNYGGTLVVESGKTATFSTTGSNRNNLANTSIINSGTSATSYGTITVNGKMSCGTVTNEAYAKIYITDADFTAGTVTNLAETGGSTGSQITVTNSTFTASTVSVNFYADFYVSGESTLDIGNLTGTIRLNDGATISNSAVYADINNSYSGKLNVGAYSSVIFAGSNTFLSNNKERGLYVEINGSATVKSTSDQQGELKAHHIQVGNLTVGSETDACIVDTISLRNGGTLTVNGKTNERSRLQAQSIENYTTSSNGSMSLTNTVLNTETLVNTCVGTLDNKPGITITDSEAVVGSLRNGNDSNRVATIKIERSEFTAGSITNYSTGPKNEHGQLIRPGIAVDNSTIHVGLYDNDHNVVAGTGDITNNAGAWIKVENSVFTALGTLTINAKADLNDGGISFANSTVSLASIVNNGTPQTQAWQDDGRILFTNSTVSVASVTNRGTFRVIGTSKLDINALDGTIETSDSGATLNDSSITGGANGGTISAQNSLTFTGANTLNGVTLTATDKTVTVGNSASLTVKGTSTLNIGNLNGTILTDTAATTTLTASSITNGTISAQNSLAFTGANTLNSVTLSAAGQAVTVGTEATLTVGGTSTLNIGTLGGTITVASGATLSNSSVGGTVKVQSDATLTLDGMNAITTLDLSEANNVTMDWQDQLSFTGFGDSYTDKLTINLDNFTAGDLSKPILDSVNNDWTKDMYEALLTNAWTSTQESSTQYEFVVRDGDLYIDLKKIVVKDGTHSTITALNGIPTEIGETSGKTTLFEKSVFGGGDTSEAAGTAETPVDQGIDLSVAGGTFAKFVAGGSLVNLAEADDEYYVSGGTQSISISGGKIESTVAVGDRLQHGVMHRVGDLNMEITGGTFTAFVSGGMMNVLADTQSGHAYIDGDIELKITGGTFTDNCWIYGGNVSSNKATISANSTINGSVTITVDAAGVADEGIVLSHIIVGSHGNGHIEGKVQADESLLGTKIVFLGDGVDDGSAVVFSKNQDNIIVGELWGSSSGDVLNPITKKINGSVVEGDRVLSFQGFNGQLDCANIRAFSKIEIKNRIKTENDVTSTIKSTVTLDNAKFNLSGVENWELDCGSTLSGNFINNFAGDTLNLIGFAEITTPQTLMTDTDKSDDVAGGDVKTARCLFNGFDGLSIKMNGTAVSSAVFSNDTWTFAAGGSNYSLALVASETSTSMILTRTPIIA